MICWKKGPAKLGTSVYTPGTPAAAQAFPPNDTIPMITASLTVEALTLLVVKRGPPLSPWQKSFPVTPPAQI